MFLFFFYFVIALTYSPLKKQNFYLDQKVLLNAESFGFGPSAAIAEIFPFLSGRVSALSYIGRGHSLDLQRNLAYTDIFDYASNRSFEERKKNFSSIAKGFDIFFTACDFELAEWAKELGLKVVIYDPLAWYWPKIPPIVSESDLYIVQNFFGVTERLEKAADRLPPYAIMPALISRIQEPVSKINKDLLLVNLGGLQNPYIEISDLANFSKIALTAIQEIFESKFSKIIFTTSQSIISGLGDTFSTLKTLQPQEVQRTLKDSDLAIMTSGLGNLFEASAMRKNVIWLPPTNDSQGQQIKLMEQHGMLDAAIDWTDIFEEEDPIDYFSSQEEVMKRIVFFMRKLANESSAQEKFKLVLGDRFSLIHNKKQNSLGNLADFFGINGGRQTAEYFLDWASQQN